MKLYHATITENQNSIETLGLTPKAGSLVSNCYGKTSESFIFAASIETIEKAAIAMRNQIFLSKKNELDLYNEVEVSQEMIKEYGVIFSFNSDNFTFAASKIEDTPIESNDYFSTEKTNVENSITGENLIDFLKVNCPISLLSQKLKRSKFGSF